MKSTIIMTITFFALVALAIANRPWAGELPKNTNVTVIEGRSSADGTSQVREVLLEECIVSLPKVSQLEAEVTASTLFLKEINGQKGDNRHFRYFSATLEINYVIKQKALVIITTHSVQGQEPITKVVAKRLPQSIRFQSNSADGDVFAGQSDRRYYFSTAKRAIADVKQRAATWIKQQSPTSCKAL